MQEKKKILILIPHYLPGNKFGGPLTSIVNLIDNLAGEYSFFVLTKDRDLGDSSPYEGIEKNRWINKDKYHINYISKKFLFILNLLIQVNKNPAHILYINGFFDPLFSISILIANKFGMLNSKNIIVAPRGELYDEALKIKKNKKRFFLWFASKINLYKNITFHASTDYEKNLIVKNLQVKSSNVRVAINMANVDGNVLVNDNNNHFINNINSVKIVFLSRISKDKNIGYTFEIMQHLKLNVIFDIYGPIEDEYIWNDCRQKIIHLPSNIIVNYKGVVEKDDVKHILSQYDLMFLPTFAENYGHAIVEALLVGTPVLISDNTPWKNLEVDGLGWDISLDQPELFTDAIYNLAHGQSNLKSREEISNTFIKRLQDPSIYEANKLLFDFTI